MGRPLEDDLRPCRERVDVLVHPSECYTAVRVSVAVHVVQAEHDIRVHPPVQADRYVTLKAAWNVSAGQIDLTEARCEFLCAERLALRHHTFVLAALLVVVPGLA